MGLRPRKRRKRRTWVCGYVESWKHLLYERTLTTFFCHSEVPEWYFECSTFYKVRGRRGFTVEHDSILPTANSFWASCSRCCTSLRPFRIFGNFSRLSWREVECKPADGRAGVL
eukprot:Pompholyxophrys_punicea_v1_NODE_1458_length_708_cov_1.975498.p2 type:complete len:114 gc:universal NODE_1458_length_708_cov_1.975498:113-454(+)